MTKFKVILFCVVMSIATLCFAKINSSVSSMSIYIDEPFQLTITSDQPGKPDLSSLYKNFNILGESSGQSMSYINGHLSRAYQYNYSLTVKPNKINLSKGSSGIILPSVSIGNSKTRAIQLTVQKQVSTIKDNSIVKTKIEVSTTPKNPFVQQEIILNIDIFLDEATANLVQSMAISQIKIPNTTIMEFKEPTVYKKIVDGKPVVIVVKKIALFPQNSGEITIPPITFTASILDNSNNQQQFGQFRSPFFTHTKTIKVTSKPKKININPAPVAAADTWLPTTMLKAEDYFDKPQDKLRVGEIMTRTLTIEANNLLAEQLPEITPKEINNVNIYSDKPQLQNFESNGIIQSQRIEEFSYVPTKPGSMTIPETNIKWYDINSKATKTITLPAKTITVLPAINTSQDLNKQPLNKKTIIKPKLINKAKTYNIDSYLFIILAIFSLMFSYLIIYYYLKSKSIKSNIQNTLITKKINLNSALCILDSKLTKANPKEMKKAYNEFLDNIIIKKLTLQEIKESYSDETNQILDTLDKALYSKENIQINGKKLFNAIKTDLKKMNRNKIKKEKALQDSLPNLYPD